MTDVVYITIVVFANQLESMRVETEKEAGEKVFVELFNQWSRSDTKFNTYDECIAYKETQLEKEESEFDDLLISFEEVVLC